MKTLTIDQQTKAISLLEKATGFIDHIRFTEGEEVDEVNLEGSINTLLNEVREHQKQPDLRITIGKKNCLNDIPIHLEINLPDINSKLYSSYAKENYAEMLKEIERLKRITKDLEDMVIELKNL